MHKTTATDATAWPIPGSLSHRILVKEAGTKGERDALFDLERHLFKWSPSFVATDESRRHHAEAKAALFAFLDQLDTETH